MPKAHTCLLLFHYGVHWPGICLEVSCSPTLAGPWSRDRSTQTEITVKGLSTSWHYKLLTEHRTSFLFFYWFSFLYPSSIPLYINSSKNKTRTGAGDEETEKDASPSMLEGWSTYASPHPSATITFISAFSVMILDFYSVREKCNSESHSDGFQVILNDSRNSKFVV